MLVKPLETVICVWVKVLNNGIYFFNRYKTIKFLFLLVTLLNSFQGICQVCENCTFIGIQLFIVSSYYLLNIYRICNESSFSFLVLVISVFFVPDQFYRGNLFYCLFEEWIFGFVDFFIVHLFPLSLVSAFILILSFYFHWT